VHIGGDTAVLQKEILGIFPFDPANISPATKEFISLARSEKRVVEICKEQQTKSFIVTKDKVFFSPISSVTLQKRVMNSRDFASE